MKLTLLILLAALYIPVHSCKTPGKKYSLTPIDSFTLSVHIDNEDLANGLVYSNFIHNDTSFISFLSTKDSAIVLRSLLPLSESDEKISMKGTFSLGINSFPNSYFFYKDTVVLCYNEIGKIVFINRHGKCLSSCYIKKTNKDDNFSADNNSSGIYYDGRIYISRSITAQNCPSFVYGNCDQVFCKQKDSLLFCQYSGQYPSNYMKEYVHLRDFFRLNLGSSLFYGFQESDTIFKFDLAGNCIKKGQINSIHGGKISPFDTSKHGDISYIIRHCILNEQNLFYVFSRADNSIYCVKRLRRDMKEAQKQTVLICLDTNLVQKYEILLNDKPINNNILFFDKGCIYSGNFKDCKIVKYEVAEK